MISLARADTQAEPPLKVDHQRFTSLVRGLCELSGICQRWGRWLGHKDMIPRF